jgi:quercetin 2,3-dioxygenase
MKIKSIHKSQQVFEGAGVKLNRVFGFPEIPQFDPFLLLDHFQSDNPNDYMKGFPWHPHRGIETVTYMKNGEVEHSDSLGNKGIIKAGDVQWMTAGSGIIHQEMPKVSNGINGFQLWVNLASKDKMTNPKYREISKNEIPVIQYNNAIIKLIAGEFDGQQSVVTDVKSDPQYFDIELKENSSFEYSVKDKYCLFIYLYQGKLFHNDLEIPELSAVLFENGNNLILNTKNESASFLLVSGKPIRQSVEWHGPIVMNNRQEIIQAFEEYQNGTFIKHK